MTAATVGTGRVSTLAKTTSGGPPSGPFESHSAEAWRQAIAQNLESVLNLVRLVLPGMRGKGVPDLRGGTRGDQIVTIQVVTPRQLTDDQRALFEELAASLGSEIEQQPNSKGFFGRMKDAFGAKV